MNVYWLIAAQERLRAGLNGQPQGLSHWLPRLNKVLADVFDNQVVLVRDRYSGYREFDGLAILFVEVQPGETNKSCRFPSPGTYIVKIAFDDRRAALKEEISAWNTSRAGIFNGDNVFVSLEAYPNAEDPDALIYGDANAVLGQRNILSLEDAIRLACRFGVPKPESVERTLRMMYERLNSRFFLHSHLEEAVDYLNGGRPNLDDLLKRYQESTPPSTNPKNKHDHEIRPIRRETLALLASHHEIFADPIDLLRGLKKANIGPSVFRGISHGDLHGLNVQVAIVHDEVSQCAVFDYESFSPNNFVAWDFIKLEIETAVRLLDQFGPRDLPSYALDCMRFWHRVGKRAEVSNPHSYSSTVNGEEKQSIECQRLEDLIVTLRVIAHKYLGSSRNREFDWQSEYELLLVWYAARAAMYPNYNTRCRVATLIAGGVAARSLIRRMPAEIELSHRYRFVKAKDLARGEHSVSSGAETLKSLARDFPHVLEIQEELALAHIKLHQFADAEAVLKSIANQYCSGNTTAESKSLLGSLWKRRAYAVKPFDRYALEQSLKWYRQGADQHCHDEFYPRINMATILLIQNKPAQAREEATIVMNLVDQMEIRDFWAMASRAEAQLLRGDSIQAALEDYRHAIRDRDCRPQDRQSMHDQIVFILPHLPDQVRNQLNDEVLAELFHLSQEAKQ